MRKCSCIESWSAFVTLFPNNVMSAIAFSIRITLLWSRTSKDTITARKCKKIMKPHISCKIDVSFISWSKMIPSHVGNPVVSRLGHKLQWVPTTFCLQSHCPLELHCLELDPWSSQSQSKNHLFLWKYSMGYLSD